MGVNYRVQVIYQEAMESVTKSEKRWKDMLRLAGKLYRYEFDNILMVLEQRPYSTLVADYDTWKKVGRFVKRGSKGIAILPSRALSPRDRYVFDITDTGGKASKLTWEFDDKSINDYYSMLVGKGFITDEESGDIKKSLKLFTGTNVWTIIRSEFEDRLNEIKQLSGSVINEFSEKRKGLPYTGEDMEELVYRSIMYVVGTRCGFDLSVQEQDFGQIVDIKDEEIIYRLGSLVCDVSCSVLREIGVNLKAIERERRIAYGSRNDLSRSGWSVVSGHRDAGGTGQGIVATGQIREDGTPVSEGQRTDEIQNTVPIWDVGREDERSGRGSMELDGNASEQVSFKEQAEESIINNGDVEDKRTGENAGGGDSTPPDSDEISLEREHSNLEDEELNKELDEINSLGQSKEVEFKQASFLMQVMLCQRINQLRNTPTFSLRRWIQFHMNILCRFFLGEQAL